MLDENQVKPFEGVVFLCVCFILIFNVCERLTLLKRIISSRFVLIC